MFENENVQKHPSVEQMIMKMAIEKLTLKQKQLWDMYAYERLTKDEIASVLKISQQAAAQQIGVIKKSINKFCKQNIAAYLLLKVEHRIMNDE